MAKTKIEWASHTFNPITGCTPVSNGCLNCYAKRMAKRLAGRFGYPRSPNHFKPTFHPERLKEPATWKKPRLVFVSSMGDLFHDDIPLEVLGKVFTVIADTPQHTYLILTKRPARMRAFPGWYNQHWRAKPNYWQKHMKHVWLGVSCEDQENFDKRVPILLEIPSAIHYVSLEPLLGPIDMSSHAQIMNPNTPSSQHVTPIELLDWVICGGESGPGARPMNRNWARNIQRQCVNAKVPFLFKQDIINGKKVGLPELDGRVWNEFPPLPNETELDDDRRQPQLLFT